jgi:hypothetical protein
LIDDIDADSEPLDASSTLTVPAQSLPAATTATPAEKATAEANADGPTLHSNGKAFTPSLPPGFIDSLRGAASLAAEVSSIKQVLGGAAALASHAKVSQQQLDDSGVIQGRPELLLFYGAVCQGLQCMLHIATAFKTGCVQLDKNSSVGGYLNLVSDRYNDAVGAVTSIKTASDLAAHAGSFEGTANAMASLLDKVADIAEGIPVASFVLKGISSIVGQVQGLKFDARMNRMMKSLFPDLNPLAWTCVVEEVARRVAVMCAPEIQALHSGTEDCRGRVKNWFRCKCSEYGLATLTSKAEDAVVMMALQKVDCVLQLALSDSVPEGLSEIDLADFIVRHVVPSAPVSAPAQASAVPSVQLSAASPDRLSPPPHDIASNGELEELRKKLEKQNKEMKTLKAKVENLALQNQDCDVTGRGGGLVLASCKSEVNEQTVNAAAAQAIRPVQQQVVWVQHRMDELAAFIMSHDDPVLKSHLEDLNNAAVPVMKKRDDVLGWQDRYVAVRRGTLFYGNTYKAVKAISDGPVLSLTDNHTIGLCGCRVHKCPEETDKSHFAFVLTTTQVNA